MSKRIKELAPGEGFVFNGQHYMVVRKDGAYISHKDIWEIIGDENAVLALDEDFQIRGFESEVMVEQTPISPEANKEVQTNTWTNPLEAVVEVVRAALNHKWNWGLNTRCKYLTLRVDMRDGHCTIRDRTGTRITLEELQYQYGEKK